MKECYCYILYSKKLNVYYTGYTVLTPEERLKNHLEKKYGDKYTSKVDDWEIYYKILCTSAAQARKIELHIKKMKSRVYIENLKKYSEISQKLLKKYNLTS